MATVYSDKSKVSMRSFQVIEDVAKKSSTKYNKIRIMIFKKKKFIPKNL